MLATILLLITIFVNDFFIFFLTTAIAIFSINNSIKYNIV